jgi:hypothetical protein
MIDIAGLIERLEEEARWCEAGALQAERSGDRIFAASLRGKARGFEQSIAQVRALLRTLETSNV